MDNFRKYNFGCIQKISRCLLMKLAAIHFLGKDYMTVD